MGPSVSIVVPAYNEESRIGATMQALHRMRGQSDEARWSELIVVNDGSTDRTAEIAADWATVIVEHDRRLGKGAAMKTGCSRAAGEIILFADADLEWTAVHLAELIKAVRSGEADMAIARFMAASVNGGFGLVKRLARKGIHHLTGMELEAPLSGQRAVRSSVLTQLGRWPSGFGVEVALTIDAVRHGFTICEVSLPLAHRETGKSVSGFLHRGRQMAAVGSTLLTRWGKTHP